MRQKLKSYLAEIPLRRLGRVYNMHRTKNIVALSGGLGNQLFQYCFGLELALEKKVGISYDIGSYSNEAPNLTNRKPMLADLGLDITLSVESMETIRSEFERWSLARFGGARSAGEIFKAAWNLAKILLFHLTVLHTGTPGRAWGMLNALPIKHYYVGNWQDWGIVEKNLPRIQEELSQLRSHIQTSCAWSEQVSARDAVVMHVRRGDYAVNDRTRSFHGLLSRQYFVAGLHNLEEITLIKRAYVFSDDIEWCKENLKLPIETHFVSSKDNSLSDVEELMLMSLGWNFVISNSTFSWWAANLSNDWPKHVVAPTRWFRSKAAREIADKLKVPTWSFIEDEASES